MQEEDFLKEAKEVEKEIDNVSDKGKSPIWYIMGVLLALILVATIVPYYSIKMDPRPSSIPTILEVVPANIEVNQSYANSITLDLVDGRDPVIKEIADKIAVKSCNSGERICHAKAMFYFVRNNFEYVSDPTSYEYVKTARESLVSGGGDCDDGSVLVASLLDAVGIKTRFVFIKKIFV